MARVMTTIGNHCAAMILTSTSMPTDTKKMAPKRSFTGFTTFSILWASTVSASMLPITKAPKAELKPTMVDITAIMQQRPRETMRSTSSFISLRTERSSVGMRNSPTTNHSTMKKPMDNTELSICSPSAEPPLAIAPRSTIMTMARMSSSISTLITSEANCCCLKPKSSNALYIIVVDDMASIPARNSPFISDHPNIDATALPVSIMQNTMTSAAMMGAMPILSIFLKEKSRPNVKSRNITPMLAHVSMFSWSTTDIVKGRFGETMKPAIMYPKTSGCFSFLNRSVTMPAVTSIKARSFTREGISAIGVLRFGG